MSGAQFTRRLVHGLLLVIVVALAARIILGLLDPLLPSLALLAIGISIASAILRGPRAKG